MIPKRRGGRYAVRLGATISALAMLCAAPAWAADPQASKVTPNLVGHVAKPLRYHPEGEDFVIRNGAEFFNRSLYGGNTAFRVDGGDKPEFVLYLPGRGGNLRLGLRTKAGAKWFKDAADITTRYRPGELIYDIRDPAFGKTAAIHVEVLAYAATEGLIVRTTAHGVAKGARLIWAYGGVNGERGSRDGDIGTEKVPISQWFQFQPDFADGNVITPSASGFILKSAKATIAGVVPTGATQHIAPADLWNDLPGLFAVQGDTTRPVIVGEAPVGDGQPMLLSLQHVDAGDAAQATDLQTYQDVTTQKPDTTANAVPLRLLPAFAPAELPKRFAEAQTHFAQLRNRVRIDTPDPYLNASVGALNVVADALWDDNARAIMHGAIAWRTALLGWRGPYALDDLGFHDRARQNFDTWVPRQNTSPIPTTIPPADAGANLSRNEAGLHSNGDLSGSHYDMNLVFIDALFRHILWTGDVGYARKMWPVIARHMAWERRLFRREYGPDRLPLYEAYADIWASDGLYNSGAGSSYASAYNLYANRMAARIATLTGQDPAPYTQEAGAIARGLRAELWMPDEGTFAETRDISGNGLLHRDYALWSFYHTIDEEAATPREAWAMAEALKHHLTPIPVTGPGVPAGDWHVYSESDWMPYEWSINNVVMDENAHTALALFQAGHADDAYAVLKGAILASQYLGITPGNLGTMTYLDVYRRESQRDFGDSAGTLSRAIVEGLFGVRPDALAGTLTIAPGFPAGWDRARLDHPDLGLVFRRSGEIDTWTVTQTARRFRTLSLHLPARSAHVAAVTLNGKAVAWHADSDAVGRPMLAIETAFGARDVVAVHWSGAAIAAGAVIGERQGDFERVHQGDFTWWRFVAKPAAAPAQVATAFDWKAPLPAGKMTPVDLSAVFNDSVTNIFAPGKYLSPRPKTVSLTLPSQGYGEWTHPATAPKVDDSGLRAAGGKIVMPNGVQFATPGDGGARNIAFTSQWDNYPREVSVPLSGRAKHLYLLMAGSTNHQQSRMDNGEVIIAYTDGTTARLALRNPETWWPIEQDYFSDDYQFPLNGPLPARVDLKTGAVRVLDAATFKGKGATIPGGAATALQLPLDPSKDLKSLMVRTLANEVVIGLMSATLERP